MKNTIAHIFNFSGWCGDERNVFEEGDAKQNELLDKNRMASYHHQQGRPPRRRNNTAISQWTPTSKQGSNATTKGTPETQVSDSSFVSHNEQQHNGGNQVHEAGLFSSIVQSLFYRCGEPMGGTCSGFTSSSSTANHHKSASTGSTSYNEQDLALAIAKGSMRAQRSNTMDEDDANPEPFVTPYMSTHEHHHISTAKPPPERSASQLFQSHHQQPPPTNTARRQSQPHFAASSSPSANATNITQVQPPPLAEPGSGTIIDTSQFPFLDLLISKDDLIQIERSVSELTMRSHGDTYMDFLPTPRGTVPPATNRRMAYYAVGKKAAETLKSKGEGDKNGGSHRRCYFTGRVIHLGDPFYAGSVQQGLRTLVVFCLPKSLGLPKLASQNDNAYGSAYHSPEKPCDASDHTTTDDTAIRTDEEQEEFVRSLPEPDNAFLREMQTRYPEPFASLPLPVQSKANWRLYVKFCYFSGLPVAEGEMHFRVKPALLNNGNNGLNKNGKEDVVLSHDVMETVNGEASAEMLKLPNKKTFTYLKKYYGQQSAKLDPVVFQRTSWEMVLPEC
jgi:hypothetical protein